MQQLVEARQSNSENEDRNLPLATINSRQDLDCYSGVSIKASFSGQNQTYHLLQQLSGGQKTVVALSLILAIQECDRAPFYLFDEVDAALDDQYRGAVANFLGKNSSESQFICTTFRPELLEPAQLFLYVTIRNRCSNIRSVSKEEALGVIHEQIDRGEVDI